jgi:hypothetical protein
MMGQRPGRETIMMTLLNTLTAAVQTTFTANTTRGDPTLFQASTAAGLFIGLPVFGDGIPRGATITSLSPLTVSQPATANGSNVSFTTGFLTFGRRLRYARDVSEQPALYLRDIDEGLEFQNIILQEQTIRAEIWIYSNAGENPNVAPVTALNNLLDAVQSAFAPDPITGRFTLGGLVHWCRMEGKVDKDPGDISGQAIAAADVLITVP